MPTDVLRLADVETARVAGLLARFGLQLQTCAAGQPIAASYWGEPEAGIAGDRLYAREDTPLHSILHEASHYVCMDPQRRRQLQRDAGSDDAEENAVCYLQILLADEIESFGRDRILEDMDRWGYSFRLGSSRAWFEQDAADALQWLQRHDLVDDRQTPRFHLRSP